MAKKSPRTANKKNTAATKVTRITASDDAPTKKTKATKTVKSSKPAKVTPESADIMTPASNQAVTKEKKSVTREKATDASKKTRRNPVKTAATPITMFIGYIKGAWYELRQVRWPNRRATWGLTGALIAFTLFFVLIILLLDGLFKYIFELILR